ncbi:HPr kinase/phosphorylase [Coxiella endosymbiont of Amblyomma nuttalli]|uniref:HPr kinase/phosphorylase n=1 Tax=Coxiella endosymbiont of Amblyomma nuttalli TaxID=2749996 RepID=UPI001BA82320|nr:HPr kinase/phosphorylase [Coxiella endosymbiont of Amblyomma nuttalli]QTS84130.1 HPr kinase/phosphorylase [Coxiella endosymbiont of Amblyomma nuttalli]
MLSLENSKKSFGHVQQKTLHANLLVIDTLGVLITGAPDIGKSELTLALFDRGHKLVCDDVVDVVQQNNKLIGSCPTITNGYILVTDIGVIDVSKLFGLDSVIVQHEIHLSIALVNLKDRVSIKDPLNPVYQNEIILGVSLPKIVFPIHTGRNLPLLIEILVRNHRLKKEGYDPSVNFSMRLQKAKNKHDSQKT